MKSTLTSGGAISTGNSEIDKKVGGGIPVGSLTLVDGHSDAGKSVLSQQMTWGALNDGYRATVFTTENTIRSLITQMASLGLDVLDHFLLGKLSIYAFKPAKGGEGTKSALDSLLQALAEQENQDLVIIDSLTSFITQVPSEEVISFFEECKGLCNKGMTLIVIVHSHALSDGTRIRISSMCDAHLSLRVEQYGSQLAKTLEVAKVRGAERKTGNIVSFDVEPNYGMRIMPFSKARA